MGLLDVIKKIPSAKEVKGSFGEYLTKYYSYRLDGDELSVTELSGRRQIVVCRLSIDNITSVDIVDFPAGENVSLPQEIKKKTKKRFDYRVDLSPARFVIITTDEGYENSAIYLSYDDNLLSLRKGS